MKELYKIIDRRENESNHTFRTSLFGAHHGRDVIFIGIDALLSGVKSITWSVREIRLSVRRRSISGGGGIVVFCDRRDDIEW